MTSSKTRATSATLAGCASGLFLALMAMAAPAHADPTDPGTPLPPVPDPAITATAAGPQNLALPPNGVPHLASPDALPPGSTMDPQSADSPNVSYLKDLWQAVQDHEISGKEALVMGLAQRGMSTPYPDQAPGPNVPVSPGDPGVAPAPAGPAPVIPAAGVLPPTP